LAFQKYSAFIRLENTANNVEKGRFSGTIGSDESEDFIGHQLQPDIAQRLDATKGL
jgi:hypothetical protein